MNPICFYHSADLDGHCSGAIVYHALEGQVEMRGIDYGDEFPWGEIQGRNVIMVDFSLQPWEDMRRLGKEALSLLWIDHHRSAIEDYRELGFRTQDSIEVHLDTELAACEKTWPVFMMMRPTPVAVWHLGRYDVWKWQETPGALEFQYGMRMEYTVPGELSSELWKRLFRGSGHMPIIERGSVALKYQKQNDEAACQSACFSTELDGLSVLAMNRHLVSSNSFESLWDSSEYDMMAAFVWRKGQWTISLYSDRSDVDCGAIAKAHGGGGHKGAAGFQCEELPEGFLR